MVPRQAWRCAALLALVFTACAGGTPAQTGGRSESAPAAPAAPAASAPAPASPAGASTTPPAPITLRWGQVTIVAQLWPAFVAEDKGFLPAEALTLDTTVFRLTSDATRALSSDSLDLSNLSTDSGILATEQGADIISIAGVLNKPLYNLIVSPEIRAFGDLRGKTLGVSDLKDGSTILLQRVLERQGLRPGDYDMVQTGGTPDRYAALKTGGTIGTMLSQPSDFLAISEGYPSLALVSDVIPDYQFSSIAVRRSWAQQNEATVLRFLRAYARACQWLYEPSNRGEAVQLLVDRLNTSEELANKTYELYMIHAQALPKAGELNLDGVRNVMDIMADVGNLPRPVPPLERYVDTSYLERARR